MSSKKVEDVAIELASKHFGFCIDEMKRSGTYKLPGDDVWMVSFYIINESMDNHEVEYMAVVNVATGEVRPRDLI